ncbi:MAG: polyphenol oxidase family protein [Paracoccaceae bacterium]
MTLDIIRSDLLGGARHAFFGRAGGASSGVYAGLNGGLGSDDQREAVVLNRARAARALGAQALIGVHQVHSAHAIRVDAPPDPDAPRPRADAMVTDRPGLALAVLSADCMPVLFAAPGLVGAAHAGWRGAHGGVLDATVDLMRAMGARDIRAAIGPCISQPAYEVGPEFVATLTDAEPRAARFFAAADGDRARFDLPGYGLWRLQALDVRAEWTRHCTWGDPARFYSYRRATQQRQADYGRLISAIAL